MEKNSLTAPIQIKGTVSDGEGRALEGATILVKGTTNGTETDSGGGFTIEADQDSTLVISYIGFKTVNDRQSTNPFTKMENFI